MDLVRGNRVTYNFLLASKYGIRPSIKESIALVVSIVESRFMAHGLCYSMTYTRCTNMEQDQSRNDIGEKCHVGI